MKKYNYQLPTTIFFLLAFFIVLLDQITKYFVRTTIPLGASYPFIKNIVYLSHTTNTGASFSLFQNYSFLLGIIAVFVVLAILLFYKKIPANYRLAFSFLLAGTLGNLIDRISFGTVTDFVDLQIWPIFNVADASITMAAILLLIIVWKEDNEERK